MTARLDQIGTQGDQWAIDTESDKFTKGDRGERTSGRAVEEGAEQPEDTKKKGEQPSGEGQDNAYYGTDGQHD